ncbi:hypothetical protein [Pseudobacter ginsenosidimutans]|uniref:hypothetical protein n=1 Tax=Pseudobacter ginsenosidimutans TaxID=661488 RepID=UPI00102DCE5D|nr:hypothetical protein [Pseudobacter ginsenosidimutans]QEC44395.1 hypothetical protein FSB84_22970 [Pseudobacter ginsenosidimutans]
MEAPTLEYGQIALLLCDSRTGHVLQKNGIDLFLQGQEEPFFIEDSIEKAKSNIIRLFQINPNLEILMYDHNGALIEILRQGMV